MGIISKVVSTVRKIDSIHTMVGDSLKKIDEIYVFIEGERKLVFPDEKLIFEKTTAGEYEFTVPEKYNFIMIEYAGGAGGYAKGLADGSILQNGGKGSIKQTSKISCKIVTGVVGDIGDYGGLLVEETYGGLGYHNGSGGGKGDTGAPGPSNTSGGGGGGSTSVVINDIVYEACGGSGASYFAFGGAGGGVYGGKQQNAQTADGNDATDPEQIGLNANAGYVRIYGIAG